jgi:quercetin dioxygenase-like cupin family protein
MKILEAYMSKHDDRGDVTGLFNLVPLEEVNIISTRAGCKRGNHYHKTTSEFFYIISGQLHLLVESLEQKIIFNDVLEEGALFLIEPDEIHTVTAITDVKWINGLDAKFSEKEPDFHIFKKV